MEEGLNQFDALYDSIVAAVEAEDWAQVRQLMSAQLTASRGMMRTALVTLKPIMHLPQVEAEFNKLADALRAGSTHGII